MENHQRHHSDHLTPFSTRTTGRTPPPTFGILYQTVRRHNDQIDTFASRSTFTHFYRKAESRGLKDAKFWPKISEISIVPLNSLNFRKFTSIPEFYVVFRNPRIISLIGDPLPINEALKCYLWSIYVLNNVSAFFNRTFEEKTDATIRVRTRYLLHHNQANTIIQNHD